MVNRATMKKDFSLLEGNFIAVKEMVPIIERFMKQPTVRFWWFRFLAVSVRTVRGSGGSGGSGGSRWRARAGRWGHSSIRLLGWHPTTRVASDY